MLFAIDPSQCPQDALNFLPVEPRARRHTKLSFNVLARIEEHAARRLAVSAGTTGLLQIILQGTWDVRMNNQADVGLINAHAERIRCCNDPNVAVYESILDILFGLWRQTRMEEFSCDVLCAQELG